MSKPSDTDATSSIRSDQALSLSTKVQQAHDSLITTIAEESIARDIEDSAIEEEDEDDNDVDSTSRHRKSMDIHHHTEHSLAATFHRPSFAGGSRPFFGAQIPESRGTTQQEIDDAINDERSLLRDNRIIPPKHPRSQSVASGRSARLRARVSIPVFHIPRLAHGEAVDEEAIIGEPEEPTETTALLGARDPELPYGGEDDPQNIEQKWEEAVLSGKIKTSWQREAKVLFRYAAPGVITFLLQNSLTMTSIFTVGHIGKTELGAVSLGSMTANITGYAFFHGLTTSLDTLCAQAYGSGKRHLVGLQLQRMVWFLWLITIPIAIVWLFASEILAAIIPEQDIAALSGRYLKVLILGAPAYALFESGKRYVQAQGRFEATTYVLLFCAPLNIFLHWLFVWKFEWGFIGCPIAVVITENLMPVLLILYIYFFIGLECWPGFTRNAFKNWGPMIRLALPGMVMVMAEFLAFEILTLSSSWISATHLGANTILQTLSVLTFQLPFPLSIAASTRVANLIGATLPEAAIVTTRVTFILGTIIGIFNMVLLLALRDYVPYLFTGDEDVALLASQVLPVNAAFQLVDAIAAQCNGLLRGLGKQEFGGYINLFAYYVIALPISFGTGFGLHWDLYGLWAGPAIGLAVVSVGEGYYIWRTSFAKASEEAAVRNAAG
ncbi:hypothetical protein AMS68_005220 [Peltaster fructicola]|uniref:MATE efflux family protein n=1 Tax=Peltaster fructicola TaxID=286661 RepID=A0A6H0XY72_9PEZI|nr:hypothetical protein AMS68_005220 [Peltaster fructicola]